MIVFINKWDLQEPEKEEEIREKLKVEMPKLEYYPFVFGSALKRKNINKLFKLIPALLDNLEFRITTAIFNQFIERVIKRSMPNSAGNLKLYYGSQVEISPPTFLFVVNDPKRVTDALSRFIESKIRNQFEGLLGSPVIIKYKARTQDEERAKLFASKKTKEKKSNKFYPS